MLKVCLLKTYDVIRNHSGYKMIMIILHVSGYIWHGLIPHRNRLFRRRLWSLVVVVHLILVRLTV